MAEAEKRALSLQIMAQERQHMAQRTPMSSAIQDENKALLRGVVRNARQNQTKARTE